MEIAVTTVKQNKDSAVDANFVARDCTYIFRQVSIMALSQTRWHRWKWWSGRFHRRREDYAP